MILIDKPKLKFLLAGRQIEIPVQRIYRKGKITTVGVKQRKPLCRVVILNASETAEGWTLTIKQHNEDQAQLLAADPGAMRSDYTNNPHKAARGEPEALTPGQLERFSKSASDRDDQIRRERAHQARQSRWREKKNPSDSRLK